MVRTRMWRPPGRGAIKGLQREGWGGRSSYCLWTTGLTSQWFSLDGSHHRGRGSFRGKAPESGGVLRQAWSSAMEEVRHSLPERFYVNPHQIWVIIAWGGSRGCRGRPAACPSMPRLGNGPSISPTGKIDRNPEAIPRSPITGAAPSKAGWELAELGISRRSKRRPERLCVGPLGAGQRPKTGAFRGL